MVKVKDQLQAMDICYILMCDYYKAIKHVAKELGLNDFYHGSLYKVRSNDEKMEKALMKEVIERMEIKRKVDTLNVDYYEKFERLIMNSVYK